MRDRTHHTNHLGQQYGTQIDLRQPQASRTEVYCNKLKAELSFSPENHASIVNQTDM